MTAPKWHEGPMVALDTETTGTDPLEERIVTAAIVHRTPGTRPRSITWVMDPDVEVPAEAAAVHGWTNDRLRTELGSYEAFRQVNGSDKRPLSRDAALFEIAAQCATAFHAEVALVVHNAAYDLTLLETELARNGIDTLTSRPTGIRGVVDPFVLEKQYDPYRKVNRDGGCRGGKYKCGGCGSTDKTLGSLCAHYGVPHIGAHGADGDALAAIRLALKLMATWPDAARLRLATLHSHQVGWRKEQADGLRAYFDKNGIEHDGVDPGWPLYTSALATTAGAA